MPKKSKKKEKRNLEIKVPEAENKKSLSKVLVILIIILIILDTTSLYVYYKPDLFSSDKENSDELKCSDGTPYDECTENKPYYCYQGELLKSAFNCGCPKGYDVDFQDCKKI